MIEIRTCETPADLQVFRVLLCEYFAHLANSLAAENMDPIKFQLELETLPAPYELLLLAYAGGDPAGCAVLKAIDRAGEKPCELKRLWVRTQFRGLGIGRQLTESAMLKARQLGFNSIYLDTVPDAMQAAHRLYAELGFKPVERYNDNRVSGVQFFCRPL